MRRAAAALLLALPLLAAALDFSPAERAQILAHGPWPPPPLADASNRVHGSADAVALGRVLFFDRRLSASGHLACATCHVPARGFSDGQATARSQRNTPSLLDAGQRRWFGWGGEHDNLWAASLAPLTAAHEIAATPASLLALLQADTRLQQRYRRLFGAPAADAALPVNLAKALAAYQATLVSPRTPFDAFRDALARGDRGAMARYPEAAQRGLRLFIGAGRCSVCHAGPAFSNGEFADIGIPFFTRDGVDSGRWGGLTALRETAYNRLGAWSDAGPDDGRAVGTRHVVQQPRHFGEFRVPGLRQLALTAPYMHDGSLATLEQVLHHYSELNEERLHADGERILRPLRLTPAQSADLLAFLRSLSAAPPQWRAAPPSSSPSSGAAAATR